MKYIILIVLLCIYTKPISSQNNNDYNHKYGITGQISISYYRRGYAIIWDTTFPINIVRGLYIEPGIVCTSYKNNNSHFFAIVNDVFNASHSGIYFGIRADIRYRFQIMKNFGIAVLSGIAFGPEFVKAYSYVDLVDYNFINFTLVPKIAVGTYVNFNNFVFDISCSKLFPVIVLYYHNSIGNWYNINSSSRVYSPMRIICISAFSIDFAITYYFK
jgi:hypothetical protein